MIYYDWLMQHLHRQTRLGDLSRYAVADPGFPISPGHLADLINYLCGCDAPENIVHAASASWQTWRQVEPERRAAEALAEALMALQKRSTADLIPFYEWLLTEQHGKSRVSDFAREAAADPQFPRAVMRPRELVAYLAAKGATDDAIRNSRLAWAAWRRAQQQRAAGEPQIVAEVKGFARLE